MKKRKIVKKIMLTILVVIVLATIGITLFVSYAPQFGQTPKGEHLAKIKLSENYKDDGFVNLTKTSMEMSFGNTMTTLKEFVTAKNTKPEKLLPVKFEKQSTEPVNDSAAFVTWFGHSAILLEIEGKRIMIDPMFGPYASPVSFFSKRFAYEEPIDISSFTNIDAVIISHDHYDHLDHSSILQLKKNVKHFFVPLGVGSHLQFWGVDKAKITELDWWQTATLDNLRLTAAPARHFSGRGVRDRDKTLWASWVVKGKYNNIYFSGDSGYGPHFKKIGEKYGPFDFTMIECGQYNEKWAQIHMMPEESYRANIDLRGKTMMPIHWGAFPLAVHTWRDPVERLLKAATDSSVVAHPYIGKRFEIHHQQNAIRWWEETVEYTTLTLELK